MSNVLEYILNLKDGITDKINKIGNASGATTSKIQKLAKQTLDAQKVFDKTSTSLGSLKSKLDQLRAQREIIPISNLNDLRRINSEIDRLERNIRSLESTGRSFRSNMADAFSAIPGADLVTNPYVLAATAMAAGTKASFEFDAGMAAINTTAQLTSPQLQQLRSDLIDVGLDGGADLYKIPEAFEKIISQTGDVAQSQDILTASIKGSKAGFTDQAVVADALAQSLSLVGKENTNAKEVLDTFFAAKRVGAGEFKDFANYMPNLIASGQALGVTFKNTAGLFAYMTGKGFSAEKSAVLLENAYTALGKSDIQEGLKGAGINVFDKKGMLRGADEIFKDLGKKISKFSDNKKSKFLESIGLKDAQAKSAFMALTADSDKLKESLNATNNAAGETDTAFENAQNPMMKLEKLWTKIQFLGLKLGDAIGFVLSPALDGLNWLIDSGINLFSGWKTSLQEGNEWVWGATVALGALAGGLAIAYVWTKAQAIWQGIVTIATQGWAAAQWLLNSSLLANPVTWIAAGIIALIALIGYVIYKTDGWGNAWKHTVNGAKLLWQTYVSYVKAQWETLVNGLMMGIDKIQIGWYKFKNSMGLGDKNANNAMIEGLNQDVENRKEVVKNSWKEVAKNGIGAASEFVKAGQSLKWNSDRSLGDLVGGLKKKIGIPEGGITKPKVPGVLDNSALPDDDKKKTKSNEAIATGGQRNNYITIHLKDLIGILNITGKDFKDGANQMQQQTEDALVRVLAMATTAGI